MDNSSNELVEELAFSWLEMHKKSALSFLVLSTLKNEELWSLEIRNSIIESTGWTISDRAFYKLLKRMNSQGVIEHKLIAGKNTGSDRKVYKLTHLGIQLLKLQKESIDYLSKIL
mgnify:CR=1 FL=1|jgi:DNA-binding PadR family transcriptional regulator